MSELVSFIIPALGYIILFGQVLIVLLFILLFIPKKKKGKLNDFYLLFKQNALTFAFLVASGAALGSLFLSEVANLAPCLLCWWQRVFMFPLPIILLVALIKNDLGVVKYVIPLAVVGSLIAIYHYMMQLFPSLLECSQEVVSCNARQISELGYITIPVMSLTTFLLIIVSLLFVIKK